MDWRLQVLSMTLKSRMPFSNSMRRLKRRMLGYKPDSENLSYTLENLEQMQSELASLNRSFRGIILEIGSGWFPTIPLMLAMDGAKHIYMTDLNPHMDDLTFQATVDYLRRYRSESEFFTAINSLDDLPATYLAPFNIDQLDHNSIDYIFSRTVLEHIPPKEIVELLSALRPKLASGGLMVHLIDNSDHLEFADKSISRINFLTWSKRKHSFVNSLIAGGENRLRHHEYPPIFRQAGFEVLSEKGLVDKSTLDIARFLVLQPPFTEMSSEQISILTSIFILAPDGRRKHEL